MATAAYFVTAVTYGRKLFMKFVPGVNVINLFSSLLTVGENKLECSSLGKFFNTEDILKSKA